MIFEGKRKINFMSNGAVSQIEIYIFGGYITGGVSRFGFVGHIGGLNQKLVKSRVEIIIK